MKIPPTAQFPLEVANRCLPSVVFVAYCAVSVTQYATRTDQGAGATAQASAGAEAASAEIE